MANVQRYLSYIEEFTQLQTRSFALYQTNDPTLDASVSLLVTILDGAIIRSRQLLAQVQPNIAVTDILTIPDLFQQNIQPQPMVVLQNIQPQMQPMVIHVQNIPIPVPLPLPLVGAQKNIVRALSKAHAEIILQNICPICLETHTKINSVITNCGHEFGFICLQTWMNKTPQKTCPQCRTFCSTLTSFRPRAKH
jgi:hypothetical protein